MSDELITTSSDSTSFESALESEAAKTGRSTAQIVGLAALSVGVWIGVDWLAVGPEAVFLPYFIPGMFWYALPVFPMAWLLQRAVAPSITYQQALVLVLLAIPIVIVANYLTLGLDLGRSTVSGMDTNLWIWLSGATALLIGTRIVAGGWRWRAVMLALAPAVGFVWVDSKMYVDTSVWYPTSESTSEYVDDWEGAEQLMFSQSERIDQIIGQMRPRDNGPSTWFVGFAGYAEEKVFAEEIQFAAETLGKRYDIGERTLLLLNDARSSEHHPIASTSGLRHGVSRIAQMMDLDNDVLVLALSSHGSAAPEISVSNGILPLNNLDGESLSAILDDAGIKWRVLVISACYAGAFIDGLASPYSAIITSAAPDRTSFGCSNERDLTYFGEAFYRDALPNASTLREAFDTAAISVVEREKAAGYKPSEPKAHFGVHIEEKLLDLERVHRRDSAGISP